MKLFILTTFLSALSSLAFANNCELLIKSRITAENQSATLFDNEKSLFIAVVCDEQKSIYQMFYAQMHDANQHKLNVPTASLSPVKLPINPNGENRVTGFLVANKTPENSYTLKLRARLADGDAIDISKTAELQVGDSLLFSESGITVGLARLATLP